MGTRLLRRTGTATAIVVVAAATMALAGGSTTQLGGGVPPGSDGGALTFFVAEGDPRSGYRSSDSELAVWALETWARQSPSAITLQPSPEPEAIVRLYWVPPDNSVFGEMRPLVVNGRQGAEVFVRADVDQLEPELAARARQDPLWRDTIVYLTCLHEFGHALGLRHTADNRDIMYFFGYGGDVTEYFARYRRSIKSRADIARTSGLSPADVSRQRAVYGAGTLLQSRTRR